MKNKFAKLLLGIMPLIGSGCSLLKKLPAAKSPESNFIKSDGPVKSSGHFISSILLSDPNFDFTKFARELKRIWKIEVNPIIHNAGVYAEIDNATVTMMLIDMPIPGNEAETSAYTNYMWPDAVKMAKQHKAHLNIVVMDDSSTDHSIENDIRLAKLHTKLIDAALMQDNATAVFTHGAIYNPADYSWDAQALRGDGLPIFDWVWLGLFAEKDMKIAYTYGLAEFNRDEIELYSTDDVSPGEMLDMLENITAYVLNSGCELKDGETIGMTPTHKLPITISEGIVMDGETIKIPYSLP